MAFTHGKSANLKVNDGGSLRDYSVYLSEASLPSERDLIETTTFGATGKSFVAGIAGWTIPISGYFDPTMDGWLATMMGLDTAQAFEYYPAGTPVGPTKPKYLGSVICSKYEVATSVDGVATFSAEFSVSGTVTRNVS